MKELSSETEKLIERYQDWYRSLRQNKNQNVIYVNETSLRITSPYEKMKGAMEWKQEYLFRKAAISKILKQRLLINKENEIAEPLIKGLIRTGYLPNNSIPETKIMVVQDIIDKYVFILGHAAEREQRHNKTQIAKLAPGYRGL